MQSLVSKTIAIHFLNKIENEDYYIYEVEIENVHNDEAIYSMESLYCSNGTNVLYLDSFDTTLLNGKELILSGAIEVNGEKEVGCVAFKKDIAFVNQIPTLEYDDIITSTYKQKINL